MPTTLELAYEHTTQESYLVDKAAYLNHDRFEILEHTTTAAGGTIKTRKHVKSEVPGFAAKIVPSENVVTQTDVWGPQEADGSRVCTFTVDIKGVPAAIKGQLTLSKAGADSTKGEVQIECKVSVPLIGGKIEGLVMDDLMKTIKAEQQFAADYIEKVG